jgi:hypothetical protein
MFPSALWAFSFGPLTFRYSSEREIEYLPQLRTARALLQTCDEGFSHPDEAH